MKSLLFTKTNMINLPPSFTMYAIASKFQPKNKPKCLKQPIGMYSSREKARVAKRKADQDYGPVVIKLRCISICAVR